MLWKASFSSCNCDSDTGPWSSKTSFFTTETGAHGDFTEASGFSVHLRVSYENSGSPLQSVGAPLRGRPQLGRPHRAAPTVACRSVPPKQAWSSGFSLHGGRTARRLKFQPRGLGSGSAQPEG